MNRVGQKGFRRTLNKKIIAKLFSLISNFCIILLFCQFGDNLEKCCLHIEKPHLLQKSYSLIMLCKEKASEWERERGSELEKERVKTKRG